MPTNEERREVAARLRNLNPYEWCDLSDEYNDLRWACLCGRSEYCGMELHECLADLIEPEPERTCRNEFDRCFAFECSECGVNVEGGDMLGHNSSEGAFNFCPNCGAKVVSE